jgi:AcrR family transcriptional regulator
VGVKPRKPESPADSNNRTRLLQAATDAFAEVGYEGTSLRAIADSAGVSFQLITYYFGSKEDLWLATVDYLFQRYLETGKGLGFNLSGNIYEQFHNHLRLLLTDMLQRPQLRKIWIQEQLAGSSRYTNVIQPQIKKLHDELALPYYQEVARLGIVKRYTAAEFGFLWAAAVQLNLIYPYFIELLLGLDPASARGIETQVDLLFRVLTAEPDEAHAALGEDDDAPAPAATPAQPSAAPSSVVYPWRNRDGGASAETARVRELEIENTHLKQLVGSLTLENKVLAEMLQQHRRDLATAADQKRSY